MYLLYYILEPAVSFIMSLLYTRSPQYYCNIRICPNILDNFTIFGMFRFVIRIAISISISARDNQKNTLRSIVYTYRNMYIFRLVHINYRIYIAVRFPVVRTRHTYIILLYRVVQKVMGVMIIKLIFGQRSYKNVLFQVSYKEKKKKKMRFVKF